MAKRTADANGEERVAQVTTRIEKSKGNWKENISKKYNEVVSKVADSAHSLHKLGQRTGDKEIDACVSNVRLSKARAHNMINGDGQWSADGVLVGKSIKDIFKPMFEKGDKYYDAFQEYMFNKANMDALADGKVFGPGRTAEQSKVIVANFEKQYPEFKESAKDVYNYLDNLMKERVNSGLVSQDMADQLKEMYEHYVPKQRYMDMPSDIKNGSTNITIQNGLKKFKGTDEDLMPLHLQMAQMTENTLRASSMNELGLRVAKHLQDKANVIKATPIDIESEAFGEFVKGKEGVIVSTLKDKGNEYTFVIKDNGMPYEMTVDKQYFDAFKDLVRIQRTLKSGRVLPLLEGVTIAGIAPSVINEMLCGDDPYYQSLRTTDKDVNFYIPIGDGEFIKIPKGRFVASMSTLPQRLVKEVTSQNYSSRD